MPSITSEYVGKQQANFFLRNHDVTKEVFMSEGEEMSKQYRTENSQQRYLQGWTKAWTEKVENVIVPPDVD